MANLDFGLLQGSEIVQTADYKSAGSHQVENNAYKQITANNTYETVYTVTTGKTYYMSAIVLAGAAAGYTQTIATGAAASEVVFFARDCTNEGAFQIALPTPVKFSSGTRIAAKSTTDDNFHIMLFGWEE